MTTETTRLRIPYPSDGQDPYYPAFEAMVRAIDAIGFSDVSSRNTLFYGGGLVTWQVDQTLTFEAPIIFIEPTYGQRQSLEAPVDPISIPPGHFLYTELSRGSTSPVDLELFVAAGLAPNINAMIMAWHNPSDNTLIWRSGARQVLGEGIDDVGNNGAVDTAQYVLTSLNAQLPNGRLLTAGTGLVKNDLGPGAQLRMSLSESGVTSGNYSFPTLAVDRYGRITDIRSNDPAQVIQRRIDLSVSPDASNFVKTQGFDLEPYGAPVPTSRTLAFEDSSGATHTALTRSWRSKPVLANAIYTTQMSYSFKIPHDAADFGTSDYFLSFYLGGRGILTPSEARLSLTIGGATFEVVKAIDNGAKRYDVHRDEFGLDESHVVPNARCVLTIAYTNHAAPNFRYEVDYGPIDMVFPNYTLNQIP